METDDDIDCLCDAPSTLAIINNSSWSITEPVTMRNKSSLLQRLILEEVIIRREGNLQALRQGLDRLKIIDLIVAYPTLMKPLFVSMPQLLSAERMWCLVSSLKPQDPMQQRAFGFFKGFLQYVEGMYICMCMYVYIQYILWAHMHLNFELCQYRLSILEICCGNYVST